MNNEVNHLISSSSIKPRVNSAPEVLMIDLKKNRRKKPKVSTKTINGQRKELNSALSRNLYNEYQNESNTFKGSENYLNISRNISLVSGKRLSVMEQNKEKFEIQFCRINVLLISMQLGLGVSMTGLGIYLRSVSPSLSWKDCSYWAGIPLLFSGVFGLYFCLSDYEIYRRSDFSRLVRIICTSLSLFTAGLTLTASLMSGSHGKWISDFSSTCDEHFILEHSEIREYPERCCVDKQIRLIQNHLTPSKNETSCICKTAPNGNFSLLKFEREYLAISCRYVLSALKDYFILQSSLMGVATGVCIWIIIIHIKRKPELEQVPYRNNRYQDQFPSRRSESPSPSFLRFLPYQNHLAFPTPDDRQIPRVIVHEIMDDNEIKPYHFY